MIRQKFAVRPQWIAWAILASVLIFNRSETIISAVESGNGGPKKIVENIGTIATTGSPGPLCVFGKDAITLVTGGREGDEKALVAATTAGEGRIIAIGHNGYFGRETLDTADTAKFMENAIVWCGKVTPEQSKSLKLTTLQGDGNGAQLAKYLSEKGYTCSEAARNHLETQLAGTNVLCLDTGTIRSADEIKIIQEFIENGGGCVGVSLGWGWLQLNSPKTIFEHPGNQLFGKYGICWSDGGCDPTVRNGFRVKEPSPYTNAVLSLDTILRDDFQADAKTLRQISTTLSIAAQTVPEGADWQKQLRKFETGESVIPSPERPISAAMIRERLRMTMELQTILTTPADKVKAHPAGDVFPGKCGPAGRDAVTIRIDPTQETGWKSLGLYAAPGAKISVEVPENVAATGRFSVRIGCHTDNISQLDSWQRYPQITREFPVRTAQTIAANSFGGILYFAVPDEIARGRRRPMTPENTPILEPFEIRVTGATSSPLYTLGETSVQNWTKNISETTSPWGEVQSGRVVLSIPTFVLKQVDPTTLEPLMTLWDEAIAACDRMASVPASSRKWRYVPDLQISVGYMHSGYPIMLPIGRNGELADRLVNLKTIRTFGADEVWGFFHEVGHNYQSSYWTTSGKVEVTCNWFSLYVIEEVCGVKDAFVKKVGNAEQQKKMKEKHVASGRKFSELQNDPFLYLLMDYQLKEAFGWDPFMKVTAGYREDEMNNRAALPNDDTGKIDQYMIRFSKAVGRNLAPFFDDWGVPLSDGARQLVADLPTWMP